jgi:hypothetical protein
MHRQQGLILGQRIRLSFLIAVLSTTAMSASCDRSNDGRSTSTGPGLTITTGPGPSGRPAASGPTGSYTLTLTVSPTCTTEAAAGAVQTDVIPDFLQVRRYDAAFANGAAIVKATDGTGNQVVIGGTDGYFAPGKPLMTMKDDELTIFVLPENGLDFHGAPSCELEGYSWYEPLGTGTFTLCGTWRGSTRDPARIEGTIAGTFEYKSSAPDSNQHFHCRATDHHFALTLTGRSTR